MEVEEGGVGGGGRRETRRGTGSLPGSLAGGELQDSGDSEGRRRGLGLRT